MYSRCLSCSQGLGKNAAIEQLPIGRRVAFDATTGRIWVICTRCRNWNLVPLEERWELVEEAEVRFGGSRIEASTENIALARTFDGTELVRIGNAPWPELTVWRYARKMVHRHRKSVLGGGAAVGGVYVISGLSGIGLLPMALAATALFAGGMALRDRAPVFRTADGEVVRNGDGQWLQLHPSDNEHGWMLRIRRGRFDLEVEGSEALRMLRRLMPRTNVFGADVQETKDAAYAVARTEADDSFIRGIAVRLGEEWNIDPNHNPFAIGVWGQARPYRISTAVPLLRLSLEMAVNELCERRFLEGDLVQLRREWEEANELATLSDDLLLPPRIQEWIRAQRNRQGTEGADRE
jgi:hypothetical protein